MYWRSKNTSGDREIYWTYFNKSKIYNIRDLTIINFQMTSNIDGIMGPSDILLLTLIVWKGAEL